MTDASVYVTRDEVSAALRLLTRPDVPRLTAGQAGYGYQQSRLRCALFLRFLWLTGCRCSEALALTTGDLHDTYVRLVTLKRRKPVHRAVPLPRDVIDELREAPSDPDGRVFPFSRVHAYKLVHSALTAAGVDPARAHPHAIRHGHAVYAVERNVPLPIIQRILGHASISTTSVYLTMTAQDAQRYYASVDW